MLKDSKIDKKLESFEWPEDARLAFEQLRSIFATAPFLRYYDSQKKLRLETDISNFDVGAVLSQQDNDDHWRLVVFFFRKLIPAEQNYETHDQELLVIVAAIKQWRHYLEGSNYCIEVLTDHNNLKGFMKQKELNFRQARWALKLVVYDFEIFHRAGKLNSADASSRRLDYEDLSPLNIKLLSTL